MPYHLHIPVPAYNSALVAHIIQLEQLRVRPLVGTTHPGVFFQIKYAFQMLESLGSARIEGNRTTIDELVEATISGKSDSTEQLREISNIEDAMGWIESTMNKDLNTPIDEAFLKELHRLTVKNLRTPDEGGESDVKPGAFRTRSVAILGAQHQPPPPVELLRWIPELIDFINAEPSPQFDLLRIAIAHHRFQHIHPFRNGNGRVGRLLTYAMLVRSGFRVHNGRILNPSAMFCENRAAYMAALSQADSGTDEDLLAWCEFVLSGLHSEINKIDRLLDVQFLGEEILQQALNLAQKRGNISEEERRILTTIRQQQEVNAEAFKQFYPDRSASAVSQVIARYKRHSLIVPYPQKTSRSYLVNFLGKDLIRSLINTLDTAGFLPVRREP